MELMSKAGFTTVRLGHLCWDSYEPGVCVRRISENGCFYLNMTAKDIEVTIENGGHGMLADKYYPDKMILNPYDGELIITK